LLDVLINIKDETGVLFSSTLLLKPFPLNAQIQSDNLEAAIRNILKGFSRVGVWNYNLATSKSMAFIRRKKCVKAAQNIATEKASFSATIIETKVQVNSKTCAPCER
jgi:hypothetical protein